MNLRNAMNLIKLRNIINYPIVQHEELHFLLKDSINNVNDKISNLVKNGDLIRLKKGFYVFAEDYHTSSIEVQEIANALYINSYISFDTALIHHKIMDTKLNTITSATWKNEKFFNTQFGEFTYKKVSSEAYSIGITWLINKNNQGIFIATPEKALCDKIKYTKGIGTLSMKGMKKYLKDDLQLKNIDNLNHKLILEIAIAYKSKNLRTLASIIEKKKI